ncbi:MAG: ABC transporter ATP-binding protein [Pseudomonadota bacterium]
MQVDVHDLVWGPPARTILHGLSLSVPAGTFVGIIGPNGSGKSSLLRCIYRLHRPSSGVILLDGTDLWQLSARAAAQRTAAVMQEAPASFGLTVAEVVRLGRTPHLHAFAAESARDRQVVDDVMAQIGLAELATRRFDDLSGGEKQRSLLARALAQQPRLLILDEPTNHLDIRFQRDMLRLAKQLGISVLASLHDLNQAASYCDQLYMLADGRIAASGPPGEILTPARIEAVFQVACQVVADPATGRPRISYEA